jgi:hypothetical protein
MTDFNTRYGPVALVTGASSQAPAAACSLPSKLGELPYSDASK